LRNGRSSNESNARDPRLSSADTIPKRSGMMDARKILTLSLALILAAVMGIAIMGGDGLAADPEPAQIDVSWNAGEKELILNVRSAGPMQDYSADLSLRPWDSYKTSAEKLVIRGQILSSVSDDAFKGFTALTEVSLMEGISELGSGIFDGCSEITDIGIPSTVDTMDYSTFDGMAGLVYINVSPNNTTFHSKDGVLFANSYKDTTGTTHSGKETLVKYPLNGVGSGGTVDDPNCVYIIPYGTEIIGRNAFEGNSFITQVIFSECIEFIGYKAFYGCTALQAVHLNTSVDTLESLSTDGNRSYTFGNCTSLLIVELDLALASFGGSSYSVPSKTFDGCTNLTVVVIDQNLDALPRERSTISIASDAFPDVSFYIFSDYENGGATHDAGTYTGTAYAASGLGTMQEGCVYSTKTMSLTTGTLRGQNAKYGAYPTGYSSNTEETKVIFSHIWKIDGKVVGLITGIGAFWCGTETTAVNYPVLVNTSPDYVILQQGLSGNVDSDEKKGGNMLRNNGVGGSGLRTVQIPESMVDIRNSAFAYHTTPLTIYFHSNVNLVLGNSNGCGTFYASLLKHLEISDSNTNIQVVNGQIIQEVDEIVYMQDSELTDNRTKIIDCSAESVCNGAFNGARSYYSEVIFSDSTDEYKISQNHNDRLNFAWFNNTNICL
jgi:hypothetical protein